MPNVFSRAIVAFPLRLFVTFAVAIGTLANASIAAAEDGHKITLRTEDRGPNSTEQPVSLPLVYAIGDRIKITIYERIVPVAAESESGKDSLSGLVERVDLTGVYTVQGDASVFLPLLGPIEVAGRTPQQVQDELAGVFRKTTGRDAKISIVITEREPIYVVGPVPNPGTYKYTPGMTILHALALSGGIERKSWELSLIIETMRESEKLQKSAERLKKLFARRAVLKAKHDGKKAIAPSRLMELAGEKQAEALMQGAATLRRYELASKQVKKNAIEAQIRSAKAELASLRKQIHYVESNLRNKTKRVDTLETLHAHGAGRVHNLHQARGEKAEVQERRQGVLIAITQAEQKLSLAKLETMKLAADEQEKIEQELSSIGSDISEEEVTLMSTGTLLQATKRVSPQLLSAKHRVSFEIVRRTANGLRRLRATKTTYLEPGDLLRINIVSSPSVKATASH